MPVLMLGKFPTLGALLFPDKSLKICVRSLWYEVHWSGEPGQDFELQMTNMREKHVYASVFSRESSAKGI